MREECAPWPNGLPDALLPTPFPLSMDAIRSLCPVSDIDLDRRFEFGVVSSAHVECGGTVRGIVVTLDDQCMERCRTSRLLVTCGHQDRSAMIVERIPDALPTGMNSRVLYA